MKQFLKYCASALTGLFIGLVILLIIHINNRPDLEIWHTAELDTELTADEINSLKDFSEYRARENVLFEELTRKVVQTSAHQTGAVFNRYVKGSWSSPDRLKTNWNKTFEMASPSATAGVLMLHGLSDSPYSMRSLAERLHQEKAWVLGLRLPGHGTAPSGLTSVDWQDFTAAVRLAAIYLTEKTGKEIPLFLVGYSNGAALALEYTFSIMLGEDLPKPAGMVLISPAVAVSPMAALARWNMHLARLPGLKKLTWLSTAQEYDPFKYNSFAVNAGDQIYQLTRRLNKQIKLLAAGHGIQKFPPTLAFQSIVDATIPPKAVVDSFFNHLIPNGHELVMFDVNRQAADLSLLKSDPLPLINNLFTSQNPFTLSLLTNQESERGRLEVRQKKELINNITVKPLEFEWPKGVYSLSHVALPFNMDDFIYGVAESGIKDLFSLGSLEARGEKGVLHAPISDLMRLRYNPFYNYLEDRTVNWIISDSGQ